jgi:hypothetical protein
VKSVVAEGIFVRVRWHTGVLPDFVVAAGVAAPPVASLLLSDAVDPDRVVARVARGVFAALLLSAAVDPARVAARVARGVFAALLLSAAVDPAPVAASAVSSAAVFILTVAVPALGVADVVEPASARSAGVLAALGDDV